MVVVGLGVVVVVVIVEKGRLLDEEAAVLVCRFVRSCHIPNNIYESHDWDRASRGCSSLRTCCYRGTGDLRGVSIIQDC